METHQDEALTQLQSFAANQAQKVEEAMRLDLANVTKGNDPLLIEVLEYALFGGGKRIRPLLVILASRCCDYFEHSIYELAAAFEYLHVATLIHDDVIDHAQERRGQKSVVNVYGMAAAILSGDWLHARSMEIIGSLTGSQGLDIFSQATTAMVNGEFLQLRYAADTKVDEEQYFSVIHHKTAGLIGTACEIGAIFAKGDDSKCHALKTYGYKLGNAFQVIDDLLDYQGDTKKTGKKTGNDFVEGKITLPLLRTLEAASTSDRLILCELLSENRADPERFNTAKDLIIKYNGFDSALETATNLSHQAIQALDCFHDDNVQNSREMLTALAFYVLSRNK